MKIFYTNSPRGRNDYGKYYDETVKILQDEGVEVISLEIQKYEDLLGQEAKKKYSPNEQHYLYVRKGIDISNAVIIDASVSSFSLGHESTMALLYKKPFLCIAKDFDIGKIIKHPKFKSREYHDERDLRNIIRSFISNVKNKHLSVRFNGYLSPEQKNFLDWYSEKTGLNASEIVRQLIADKMKDEMDFQADYTKYFEY